MKSLITLCLLASVLLLTCAAAATEIIPNKDISGSGGYNCEICTWVVDHVFDMAKEKSCDLIKPEVHTLCDVTPWPPVGPIVCDFLVDYLCKEIMKHIKTNSTAEETCTRIGFCAGPDSKCHSFGKEEDNGRCTSHLANQTQQKWRLEWNALPWWKNKGCNPPKHFGIHPVYCSPEYLGCCLSGWTPHDDVEKKRRERPAFNKDVNKENVLRLN